MVVESVIQVGLQFVHRLVEFASARLGKELFFNRADEALDKAVGLWPGWLRPAMLNVTQGQVELVEMLRCATELGGVDFELGFSCSPS